MSDFYPDVLAEYLAGVLPGSGAVSLERIPGGMSNPTYFMEFGGARYVLRKQPPGKLLPSAHAIDRGLAIAVDADGFTAAAGYETGVVGSRWWVSRQHP